MSKSKEQLIKFNSFYDDIYNKMVHKKYYYSSSIDWLNTLFEVDGLKKYNQIYWKEILLRSHYTATVSLLRNEKWLKGIILSIDSNNYILFTSSLRGFLESVTDSYYSLLNTPFDIAGNFCNIKLAIEGHLKRPLLSQRLEESLIHFQFAKRTKRNDKKPKYLKAFSTNKYINFFDSNKKIKDLYKLLCEVVHPASKSVNHFSRKIVVDETLEYAMTDQTLDSLKINEILNKFADEIEELLRISINAPFICLKILNLFDYNLVKSTYIETCTFNKHIKNESWMSFLVLVEQSYQINNNTKSD